jgi:hypothetical protein
VGEPRRSAERRRLDERRDHLTAGFANRRVEPCPARGDWLSERRPVEADRAVRFDEYEIHVRALNSREVGGHRRAVGQRPRSRNRLCNEPELPRIGADDGRGERVYGDLARDFGFRGANDEPGHGGERERDQRTALMVVSHRGGDAPPGESEEGVEECQRQQRARDRQDDEPP